MDPERKLQDLVPDQVSDLLARWGWRLGLGLVALIMVWVGWRALRGLFRRPPKSREASLEENLADYPPPPGQPGHQRLTIDGVPVRLRLVVAAVAKTDRLAPEEVEALLDRVVKGLTAIAQRDRPRVRIWPTPLSHDGFARTFHRVTRHPDTPGRPSSWVLAAGTVRIDRRTLFVGLAVLADELEIFEPLILQPEDWPYRFRVQTVD
jgi:hypothetical protein